MNSNNKLAVYGERDEVREFTERLKATMPGGQRLSDVEARSLAQLSIAHQLDPFNGEAWIIPGSGLMVGIKGLRKKARQMSNDENSTYWTELRQVEPSKYQAGENAVVYECHLRDTITVQAWSKSIHDMTSAGVPYQEAVKYLGPSPVIIGVGISTTDERSKMGIHARARKRAEADAIKQRYDVDFGRASFSEEEPEIIPGTYTEQSGSPRSELEILSELGFDAEEPPLIENEPGQPNLVDLTLEEALEVVNSNGTKYGEIATETLVYMANSIQREMDKGKVKDDHLRKMEAIKLILKARAETA